MGCGHKYYNECPSAGYPTPPPSCGCGCNTNPGPAYIPPPPGYDGSSLPGPIQVMGGRSYDDTLGQLFRHAQGAASAMGYDLSAGDLGPVLAGCGKWQTDGINEHKLCCTPSVGRGGVKISACIKISRPYDPWAQYRPPPLGLPPSTGPTWPVPQ